MNRVGRAAVMLTLGFTMTRLLWTGAFGWFIQQRMQIPLLIATIVLIMLGLYEAIMGTDEESKYPESRKRSTAPKIGWLMILPLLVIVSVQPVGLGAAAADRVENFTPVEPSDRFPELEVVDGQVEMRVLDFVDRAIWDDSNSLNDQTVRLEGLVVNDPAVPDGFLLTRFLVSCCAADGVPIQVALPNVGQAIPNDSWAVVDVQLIEPDVAYRDNPADVWFVEAEVLSIEIAAEAPTDAYESPYE